MFGTFKNMLSESTAASCMRFCVTAVITSVLFNYIFANIYLLISKGETASLDIQDIIALLGVLTMKLGQKQMEKKQ